MNFAKKIKENEELFNQLIEDLINEKLTEYDDLVRAAQRSLGRERSDYLEDAKGVMTTIEDLLTQLDGDMIRITTEKAQ